MKFEHQISKGTYHIICRASDRRTLLFLLYNAKFSAKIAKNRHYALIGVCRGETLSRHVINFDQCQGTHQTLALYYKVTYSPLVCADLKMFMEFAPYKCVTTAITNMACS